MDRTADHANLTCCQSLDAVPSHVSCGAKMPVPTAPMTQVVPHPGPH